MKTFKKISLAVILLVCTVGISLTASGMIFAISDTEHMVVSYQVALSQTVSDSQVALTATVTNNGDVVRDGIQVDFYYSIDAGTTWNHFVTAYTDAGIAQATYTISINGAYDFRATAIIP